MDEGERSSVNTGKVYREKQKKKRGRGEDGGQQGEIRKGGGR